MVALVYKEPDMGTACMVFFIAAVMLFIAGLSMRYIVGRGAGRAGGVYRDRERAVPHAAPEDVFLAGLGPAGPRIPAAAVADRGRLGRIPRRGPDGEPAETVLSARGAHRFHFFGDVRGAGIHRRGVVLALFAVYGWRGFVAAMKAPDEFGRLLGIGITAMVVGQALVNLSVVLGLVPTKGIPLPFISYGGSSLLGMLLATGVLLNISQHAEET